MKIEEPIIYPLFEPNQILTSTHLNQLRDYLDGENRLTRTKLSGFGIVCGLEVHYDSGVNTIKITRGYGITSDGYLIGLGEDTTYNLFKGYTLPVEPAYAPLVDENNQQKKIIEIFPAGQQIEGTSQLNSLDLNNMVALLFLEWKDEELKSCTGTTCDNKGKRREHNVRVLLIDKNDLEIQSLQDTIGRNEGFENIHIERVIKGLNQTNEKEYVSINLYDIEKFDQIANAYKRIIEGGKEDGIDKIEYIVKILDFIKDAHDEYKGLLGLKDVDIDSSKNTDYLEGMYNNKTIQYAYDFLKDLILAYNEFNKMACELKRECCPDVNEFPRHLMLGEVQAEKRTEPDPYRNYFISASITPNQDEKTLKAQWLFMRIISLIENFDKQVHKINKIKITPSREDGYPLSERSIPYYYKNSDELRKLWNPNLSLKGKSDFILSYHSSNYNSELGDDKITPITQPLKYNIDEYPFFRIEGHVGQNYDKVKDELIELKEEYNLPFEILALKLNPDHRNVKLTDTDACVWKDLQTDYINTRNQFFCLLEGVLETLNNPPMKKLVTDFLSEKPSNIYKDIGINKILEDLKKIKTQLPQCIDDFDFSKLYEVFKPFIQIIIILKLELECFLGRLIHQEKVKTSRTFYQEPDRLKKGIERLQICIDNCIYVRLFTLYHTYRWRRQYLKKNHLSIFKNFVKKYPGIEHQAGVPKGGTFIIVYMNNNEGVKVVADFSLPYAVKCGCCDIPPCKNGKGKEMMNIPLLAKFYYAETEANKRLIIPFGAVVHSFQESEINVINIDTKDLKGEVKYEKGVFNYTYKVKNNKGIDIAKGYIDTFGYNIKDEISKSTVSGTVTILVKDECTDITIYVDNDNINPENNKIEYKKETRIIGDKEQNVVIIDREALKKPFDSHKIVFSWERKKQKGESDYITIIPVENVTIPDAPLEYTIVEKYTVSDTPKERILQLEKSLADLYKDHYIHIDKEYDPEKNHKSIHALIIDVKKHLKEPVFFSYRGKRTEEGPYCTGNIWFIPSNAETEHDVDNIAKTIGITKNIPTKTNVIDKEKSRKKVKRTQDRKPKKGNLHN